MKKVCAKVVPKVFTPEQKEHRENCCVGTPENIENDPDFFQNVITCDETWIFQHDPESKRQSMHWKSPQSPRKKKARMSKSKFKAMMIVFFRYPEVIYIDWVPEGQTVNQVYYKNVLTILRERVHRRRPDMWKNASWILHHDNAPAHNALSVKRYLAKKQHSSDGTSTVLSGPSTVRLFSLPENQVCTQRNQDRVRGCSEG